MNKDMFNSNIPTEPVHGPRRLRVALLMDTSFAYNRSVMRGIHEHLLEHSKWFIHQGLPESRILPALREWAPDGVIAHASEPEFAEGLRAWGGPVISTTNALLNSNFPVVDVDHEAAGRLAANHFLEHGHTQFAFFGSKETGFSLGREKGYCDRLLTEGLSVHTCHADSLLSRTRPASWVRSEEEIERWLLELPRPCAVFVSNDISARTVTNAAALLGLNVPEELSILSVDNDEFECLFTTPTLSSIEIPGLHIGRTAAEMLQQMMDQPDSPPSGHLLPPTHVIERQSTDLVATDDPAVRTAVSYIREHFREQISVDQIAESAGCSRRTLERRFRNTLQRTVHDELTRQRLARARRLLQESDLSIEAISDRSGFTDQRRLNLVFKQHFETTPLEFRRSLR
jgi:LacI family transcriptional regulator